MQQAYIAHMKRSGGLVPRDALKDTSERWRMRNNASIYNPGTTYYAQYDADQPYDMNDVNSPLIRVYGRKSLAPAGNFQMGWRQ
jgi:hypothetical protein